MMVSQMGFSPELGQVAWSRSGGGSFLGAQMAQPADCSGYTADLIDSQVKVRRGLLWWVWWVCGGGGGSASHRALGFLQRSGTAP
jgi:hypothetical protein